MACRLQGSDGPEVKEENNLHGHGASILDLPNEILIMMAKHLVNICETEQGLTVLPSHRTSALLPLSLTNHRLRSICRSAGLFQYSGPQLNKIRLLENTCGLPPLRSFAVDLDNEKLYKICAKIMRQTPTLQELHLFGKKETLYRWKLQSLMQSELFSELGLFKGKSLLLRDLVFYPETTPILATIGSMNIENLHFERSCVPYMMDIFPPHFLNCPLFPSLRKVKYVAPPIPVRDYYAQVEYMDEFIRVFVVGCKLTHFEISYSSTGVCIPGTQSEEVNDMGYAHHAFSLLRGRLFTALQRKCGTSLRVLIDDCLMSHTFPARSTLYGNWDRPTRCFRALPILVFKTCDIHDLIREGKTDVPELCPAPKQIRLPRARTIADHHHSRVRHFLDTYECFHKCKCVVIECTTISTCNQGHDDTSCQAIYDCLWKLARHMNARAGGPRYLIVGNPREGYYGVERKFGSSWEEKDGSNSIHSFEIMTKHKCLEMLLEI